MDREIIDVNTIFGFWPKRKADIALETLLRLMEEKGISRACTLSARGVFYDFIEGNQETLAAAQAHPQLMAVGTVNPCRWLGCLIFDGDLVPKVRLRDLYGSNTRRPLESAKDVQRMFDFAAETGSISLATWEAIPPTCDTMTPAFSGRSKWPRCTAISNGSVRRHYKGACGWDSTVPATATCRRQDIHIGQDRADATAISTAGILAMAAEL